MKLISIFYILATNFMSVDEIKPGMEGYGLTVFKGTKIDTFNVKVIDVMKNAVPKGDIILVRIYGKKIDTAGVIAGMSGSPIYIDNKLVGALAYNFSIFGKEAIAGVTPIKEMISPPSLGHNNYNQIKFPFYCYGMPSDILEELCKKFPSLFPINENVSLQLGDTQLGITGNLVSDDSIIPEPGSVLGIPLVIGDLTWAVSASCTYVDGNKIYGFGHPFALLGKTEFPMTAGYVYSVVPSAFFSYKLSTPTKVIGTIKEDNDRGVIGIIGEIPDMIGANFIINNKKFEYKIVKERIFFELFLRALLFYSIFVGFKRTGESTMDIDMKIEGSHNFNYKDKFTGEISTIARSISEVFQIINNNPFEKIDIKNVSLNITTKDSVRLAKIIDVYTDKEKVYPGDTLNLIVYLGTYREGIIKKIFSITIPGISKGSIIINVESGKSFRKKIEPTNIDKLKEWLMSSPKNNDIVITIAQKGRVLSFLGEKLPHLPHSISSFKIKDKEEAIIEDKDRFIFKKIIPMDWIILGKKSIKLEVL